MTLLVLAGPTASGKTEASLAVAQRYGATVISADAMQVYRGLDIGTAKATPAERAQVPHEGIDLVDPHEPFDAAAFAALADEVIARGAPVVVAGGTSLYIRALLRGLVPTPSVDPDLRQHLEGMPDAWARLREVDPVLAARLHPNDRIRVIRGLEVWHQTGRRLSELQAEHAAQPDRHTSVGLWLDRDDLDERIDARVLQMMDAGYLEEVQGLLESGVTRELKPMRSLGYRHLCDHLLDGLPLDEAIRRTQRDTRHFARKQRNWMRQLGFERVLPDVMPAVWAAAEAAFG